MCEIIFIRGTEWLYPIREMIISMRNSGPFYIKATLNPWEAEHWTHNEQFGPWPTDTPADEFLNCSIEEFQDADVIWREEDAYLNQE